MRREGGPPHRGEEGFALAVVLILLFAIGVAGATAYQVVQSEASLATSDDQGNQAFSAAAAGLRRFVAEQRDVMPVERTYVFGRARAVVTPRLVRDAPFPTRRYLLRTEGTYTDPRVEGESASRTIFRVVDHHRSPVPALGALMSPANRIDIDQGPTKITGHDVASSSECSEAPAPSIAGIVASEEVHVTNGATVYGSSQSVTYGSTSATMEALELDWQLVIDPSFPVEHDDTWPDFGSIPADSFPAIRWNGDFDADESRTGRGLLIVTEDLRFYDDFEWDGIILANDMLNTTNSEDFFVRGLVVVGLDGVGEDFTYRNGGRIYYHSCNVLEAGRSLAHVEEVSGTWWQGF